MEIKVSTLNQICEILTGFQFRGKVESDRNGKVMVIQMKDFSTEERIFLNKENLTQIKEINFSAKYLIRKNDVLLCARGSNNFAMIMEKDLNDTIAASQFYILRNFKGNVFPGFVAAFLNHPKTQRLIASLRGGTATQILNSKALGEIPIPLPKLEIQQIIAKIFNLQQAEKTIFKQLQIKREYLINTTIENALEGTLHE